MSKPSTPAADALFSDALFSDQWLTLREPADHLARDAQLAHAADRWLTQRATPTRPLETQRTLVDLGCGSGETSLALLNTTPHQQAEPLQEESSDHQRHALEAACDGARHTGGDDGADCEDGEQQR